MKLGALPAKRDARDLLFASYFDRASLPKRPKLFGHEALVPTWGMLANDSAGDCVWAGAGHETMVWTAEAGDPAVFDDASVLSDYSAVTGYDPGDPSTDVGTDVREALKYRRTTGVLDASGKRHKIGAFVALEPGNVDELEEAMWLLGAAAIGLALPNSAVQQFDRGQPWAYVAGSTLAGGHYVPGVAVRAAGGAWSKLGLVRWIDIVTWDRVQPMTAKFYEKCSDQAFAILSEEMMLPDGKSLEGFNLAQLRADLALLPQMQAAA